MVAFSRPLAEGLTPTSAEIRAEHAGEAIPASIHVAPDRYSVTLFYQQPLPASSRVRVFVNGDALTDDVGLLIDADENGEPGGLGVIDFDTLGLTVVDGTRVCGRVFASELAAGQGGSHLNDPLEGVRITVDGMEAELFAVTDAAGDYCLEPAPSGRFFVHIDGSTAVNPIPAGAYYPTVGKPFEAAPGETTTKPDIFLPLIASDTLEPVSTTEPTEITFPPSVLAEHPDLAGVSITVPADSLFADNGDRGGSVGIAPVPPDRLPGPLPEGVDFPLVITVQTDGATNFDRPAGICFPNLPDPVTGEILEPEAKSALWSFNHDSGEFEVTGAMTVSRDGTLVCTDPGEGVLAPGWHGTRPGSQLRTPPPVQEEEGPQCEGFTFRDAYRLGKAIFDCIKDATRIGQIFNSLLDAGEQLIDAGEEIVRVRSAFEGGTMGRSELRDTLSALNNIKSAVLTVVVQAKEANPVQKGIQAVKCLTGFLAELTGVLCDDVECGSSNLARVLCAKALPIANLMRSLESKLDDVETFINNSIDTRIIDLCAVLESLIAAIDVTARGGTPMTDQEIIDELNRIDGMLTSLNTDFEPVIEIAKDFEEATEELEVLQSEYEILPQRTGAYAGAYYRLIVGPSERRGRLNAQGQLTIRMAPGTAYRLEVLQLSEDALAVSEGTSPPNGRTGEFAPFQLTFLDGEDDTDGDLIPDIAEPVVGTDPADPDSDDDMLLDGAEVL